jgi:hypothetical protein
VNIPGLTPGQFYQAGSLAPQGMSFGTPRNWGQGGQQMYDPQYVRPLVQDSGQRTLPQNTGQSGIRIQNAMQSPRVQSTTTPAYPQQTPNISTGITVGPVMPQAAVNQEQNRLRNTQVSQMPKGPVDYSPFMSHLNSLLSGQVNEAATDFGRDASFANAQQMLGTQQANARAGTGWGGVALQQHGNQLGNQQQSLAMLLSLLGQFGV